MILLQKIALIFTIIGGLNWGLIGIFDFNLVTWLFHTGSVLTRTIYILVGVCSLFNLGLLFIRNRHTRSV